MRKHAMFSLMLWLTTVPLPAQDHPAETVLSSLLREAAAEAAARVASSSIVLRIVPDHAPVMVMQVFSEELLSRGVAVSTIARDKSQILDVDIREMKSATAKSDNSSYLRNTTVLLGALLRDEAAGRLHWSHEFNLSHIDTLGRAPGQAYTDWLRKRPGFWDTFFEPVLVTATAVIIMVLLFTVRGSS